MATIHRYPLYSHATSAMNRCLIVERGRGITVLPAGASLWFRPLSTSLAEVPLEDQEFAQIFRVTTQDRQEVSVQSALTVRVINPEMAARHLDFSLDIKSGIWIAQPLQALQNMVTNFALHYAAQVASVTPLHIMLDQGLQLVHDALNAALPHEARLSEAGISVIAIRVTAVRANEELERALQTKVRESAQAEADRATYDRRAQAVDRERAIKENELNNRTELARRERELVELEGANERRRAEQEIEKRLMHTEAEVERRQKSLEARVAEITRVAEAENTALNARLTAYNAASTNAVIAAIAPEVLEKLPSVNSLTITPDMIGSAVDTVFTRLQKGE